MIRNTTISAFFTCIVAQLLLLQPIATAQSGELPCGSSISTMMHGQKEVSRIEKLLPNNTKSSQDVEQPILSWQPVDGATCYQVGWFEFTYPVRTMVSTKQKNESLEPKFAMPIKTKAGRMYEWFVRAYNSDGIKIASWNAYFLSKGTDPKLLKYKIHLMPTNKKISEEKGLSMDRGLLQLGRGGPGWKGLKKDDLIFEFDGSEDFSSKSISDRIVAAKLGELIPYKVLRENETVQLTLEKE